MIIATAGHVDHGKTSLIRQLTGVETDRLEEERRRGLSINLGYAYLPHPGDTPLGFIDVPGHRRFINTMISGISGIDMGMLVVAADDGPMPQTHEHLDVLELLGVEQLILVVSKIDRVSEQRRLAVEHDLRSILAPRKWQDSELFAVSSSSGQGIEPLRSHLIACARQIPAAENQGYFRLSIDRAFTVKGAGLVVTGTASAGAVHIGDSLTLLPAGIEARVRGIRAHDIAVETACAGQRVALNISARVEAAGIGRGDWLTAREIAHSSKRLDVSFKLLPAAPFPLKHLAPVKFHIGAKRMAGRLALLDTAGERLQPGDNCLAQLILDDPATCIRGERFLLRDHAENVILGGGMILDPLAPSSGKSRPDRLDWLKALGECSIDAVLEALVGQDRLVDIDLLCKISNLRAHEAPASAPKGGHFFSSKSSQWLTSQRRWQQAGRELDQLVHQWHRQNPHQDGIKMTELMPAMGKVFEAPIVMAVLVAKLEAGQLVLHEGHIREKGFKPAVSSTTARRWLRFRSELEQSGARVPPLFEISQRMGINQADALAIVKAAVKNQELCRITDTRFALPGQMRSFAQELIASSAAGESLTVAGMKSRFGIGRKLTVEVLEFFDSIHFTKRQGEIRLIVNAELPGKLFTR